MYLREASAAAKGGTWRQKLISNNDLCEVVKEGVKNTMQTKTANSVLRAVLAFVAVLVVAGPSLLLADGGPCPDYQIPKLGVIIGPNSVAPNGSATYALKVTFKDNSTALNPTGTGFTAVRGAISSSGNYTAPSEKTRDKVQGTYAACGATVIGSKVITIK